MSEGLTEEQIEEMVDLASDFRKAANLVIDFLSALKESLDPLFQDIVNQINTISLEDYKSMSEGEKEYTKIMARKLREAGYEIQCIPPESEKDN